MDIFIDSFNLDQLKRIFLSEKLWTTVLFGVIRKCSLTWS